MAETTRFGFEAFGGVVSGKFSDHGYKYTYGDRHTLDRILTSLEAHDHAGGVRLADPEDEGTGVVEPGIGNLPGDRTYYYRYSLLDRWGLETAASPETSVQMPVSLTTPAAPALLAQDGGTLVYGHYYYGVARYLGSIYNTTLMSPAQYIPLAASSNNAPAQRTIKVTFPATVAEQSGWVVFRQKVNESVLYKVVTVAANATAWTDSGGIDADCSWMQPLSNTTRAYNRIKFQLPPTASKTRAFAEVTVMEEPATGQPSVAGTFVKWRLIGRTQVLQGDVLVDVETSAHDVAYTYAGSGNQARLTYVFDGEVPSSGTSVTLYRWRSDTGLYHQIDPPNLTGLKVSSVVDNGQATGSAQPAPKPAWKSVDPTASSWRLYRTTESGNYSSASLVKEVVETEGGDAGGELVSSYTDQGSALEPGAPRGKSATLNPAVGLPTMNSSKVTFNSSPTRFVGSVTNVQDALVKLADQALQDIQLFTIAGPSSPQAGRARWYPGVPFAFRSVTVSQSVADGITFNIKVNGVNVFTPDSTVTAVGTKTFVVPAVTQYPAGSYITIEHLAGLVSATNSLTFNITINTYV